MITPAGSIRCTCSTSSVASIFTTLGFLGRGLELFVVFGRGAGDVRGFGSQGIHGLLRAEVDVGFGEGEDVVIEPGLPFFTLITRWFSSLALTSIQVSPSHSSAPATVGNISVAMRVSESRWRITPN